MDAGNQTTAARFLPAAANLSSIETNAADFTPTLPELLFGNNPPQLKVCFYCREIGLTGNKQTRPGRGLVHAHVQILRLCVRFVVQLCKIGGRASPRPQVSSYVTTHESFANHKSDVEQLEGERGGRGGGAPPSKRSRLFRLRWKHLRLIYGTNARLFTATAAGRGSPPQTSFSRLTSSSSGSLRDRC